MMKQQVAAPMMCPQHSETKQLLVRVMSQVGSEVRSPGPP